MKYASKIKLLEIHYDIDSPSDEGSLLVEEENTKEQFLCCDVDLGEHLDRLKIDETYNVFFSTFGTVNCLNKENKVKKEIHKNKFKGITKMFGKVVDIIDQWYVCDVGFYVFVMSIKNITSIKCGDYISIDGGVRIELSL